MDTTLPTGQRGRIFACAVTAILLLILWLAIVSPLADFYAGRADRLEQRESVAAHMARVAASLPALKSRAAASGDDGGPESFTIEGGSDAVAAASLQNMLQDMANTAGASLSSVEIVPASSAGTGYRRIGLKLSLSIGWPTLVALMQTIEQSSPPMLIDDVEIHASPIPGPGPQKLDAGFTVYAFRAVSPTDPT